MRRICTSFWAGKRVLVTGASGFIGSEVCRALGDTGAEVHGTSCTQPPPGGLNGHRATLPEDAVSLMAKVRPAVVLHLAAPISMSHEEDTWSRLRPGIVAGTAAVAQAAAAHGAHLIHISTCAVYEGGQAPFSETQLLAPSSPYAQLKLEAEHEVLERARSGLRATVLRPFRTYGPGCTSGLVADACRAAVSGLPLALTDGSQIREWNHVSSMAQGILWAAQMRPAGDVLNLGGGDRVSVGTLAERIFRLAGAAPELLSTGEIPRRPGETDRFWGDHRSSEVRWGPLPHVALDEGLRQTLDWHRSARSLAR